MKFNLDGMIFNVSQNDNGTYFVSWMVYNSETDKSEEMTKKILNDKQLITFLNSFL